MDGANAPGSSLAVVAIPAQDDPVWQISSEKVPHLTLLFLGNQANNPNLGNIESAVDHVANASGYSTTLDVIKRGPLGEDNADVLFFSPRSASSFYNIRENLLQNNYVAAAYNSTPQYPSWTPHLTLGYPSSPAYTDTRPHPGIFSVRFDRIALWVGDYEGPEFPLKGAGDIMAHSSDSIAQDILKHYGVKGMHWGVRGGVSTASVKRIGQNATKVQDAFPDKTKKAFQTHAKNQGGIHKLSDKELQAMINRMEMEKKFDRFMKEDFKRRAEGLMAAGRILGEVGKIALPIVLGYAIKTAASNHSATGSVFRSGSAFVNRKVIEGTAKAIGR